MDEVASLRHALAETAKTAENAVAELARSQALLEAADALTDFELKCLDEDGYECLAEAIAARRAAVRGAS